MTGVAAGLAMNGLRPMPIQSHLLRPNAWNRFVTYLLRNLPVTIVGVGSGLGYAELGATHQSLEDIAFLRALPNMAVLCQRTYRPLYTLRFSVAGRHTPRKKEQPAVHSDLSDYCIGKALTLRDGNDVAYCNRHNCTTYSCRCRCLRNLG